jgi:hypothetical protein
MKGCDFVSIRRWALGACLLLTACSPSYREKVLDLAVDDLHCPRNEISVAKRGALAFGSSYSSTTDSTSGSSTFRVDAMGCGTSSAYACTEYRGIDTSYTCCNMGSPGCY